MLLYLSDWTLFCTALLIGAYAKNSGKLESNDTSNDDTTVFSPVVEHAIKERVENEVRKNPVLLYSKTSCKHSKQIKKLLFRYHLLKLKVVELDLENDMDKIQDYLYARTGVRTVPQLFIGENFFGGYNETERRDKTGELEQELRKVGAIWVPTN